MNKEQQNFLWMCIPKDERNKIISAYACNKTSTNPYNQGYSDALRQLYGEQNLTSDTEPEEVLVAKADDVKEFYDKAQLLKGYKETKPTGELIESWLSKLFGDKFMPMKEEEERPKPKFNLEDKVKIRKGTCKGKICTVNEVEWNDVIKGWMYRFKSNEILGTWYEEGLEYYIEPKFDIGQKVRVKDTKQIGIIKEPYSNDVGYRVYFEDGDGGWDKEYSADELKPYTEPKIEDKDTEQWTPKENEEYWYIDSFFKSRFVIFKSQDCFAIKRIKAGNCFRTQEICNQAIEAVKNAIKNIG